MNTTHTNEPTGQKEKRKEIPSLGEISLRDYFAAKAMQGTVSDDAIFANQFREDIAKDAYAMADAMLKAREAV